MKKSSSIVLTLLILFAGGVFFVHREKPLYNPEIPAGLQTVEGVVTDIVPSARVVTIKTTDNQTITLALDATTTIFELRNPSSTTLAAIREGFTIRAVGTYTKTDTMIPAEVRVTIAPNIFVTTPRMNDEIGLPLTITGEARVFENTVSARILDSDGTMLAETFGTAAAADVGQYGAFEITFSYPEPKYSKGFVEIFDYSAQDGSEIDKVTIPIRFKSLESMQVRVYFPSTKYDGMECEATYPVMRRIMKTAAPARAALEELLRGPTTPEYREGFLTSIPGGVKIQKLTIEKGVAYADFSKALDESVGGSCRVFSIQSQIKETLMQFSTVTSVVISIDGRVEDILQP